MYARNTRRHFIVQKGQNMTIDHSLKGGGADNCMTVWHYKKNVNTKRDQLNIAKDLTIVQFDLKLSLAYRYMLLIKLNKIEVISLGLKMKVLLIFMWNVMEGMSKYDNMMVIEGGGMPTYKGWWQ